MNNASLNQDEFKQRRQAFMAQLNVQSVAVIPTACEVLRNGDAHFLFRPASDFYYLTGFNEPEAIAVFIRGTSDKDNQYILFNRERDPLREQWDGKRVGQDGALADLAVDAAYPISEFMTRLTQYLLDCPTLYYQFGHHSELDQQILAAKAACEANVRQGQGGPRQFIEPQQIIHELRLRKSAAEIGVMREACALTAAGHCRAMSQCRPGMWEYQLEAELRYSFQQAGAPEVGYSSIVAGGNNACILHYVENNQQLKDGDLVLIDAGAEYGYYSADITRTFPVNGQFSREQQALYEIVLATNEACIDLLKPGISFNATQELAIKMLTQGLLDLGILQGNLNDLIADKAYLPFYMHRVGHWLGLDVHDSGPYKVDGDWRQLEAGMVLTIEPGLYIAQGLVGVDEKWWGIGIRVEDDLAITDTGSECLTADVPKDIAGMTALMSA